MFVDVPTADGEEEDEEQQVKIVGGEDAEGAADEKIVGGYAYGKAFAFVLKKDAGNEIAAQDEEKSDEGAHEGKLEIV